MAVCTSRGSDRERRCCTRTTRRIAGSGGAGRWRTPLTEGAINYIGKQRWDFPSAHATSDAEWERHREILADQQPFRDFRHAFRHKDGSIWHVSISGKPMFDVDGKFVGYRGTGREVTQDVLTGTELRAAKDRTKHAESPLRDAVDSISEGFLIYDRNDRLLWNEAQSCLYPSAKLMVPGTSFETLLRNSIPVGHCPEVAGREAEWCEEFLRAHQRDRPRNELPAVLAARGGGYRCHGRSR